jgi:hypothetical protein
LNVVEFPNSHHSISRVRCPSWVRPSHSMPVGNVSLPMSSGNN